MSKGAFKHNASGRTVRRQSSRKRRSFVMLERYMIASAAWRSLSGEAIAAFVELSNRYNGTNNGRLHLSSRELAVIRNGSRRTGTRAMSELVRKGFVEMVKASGFNVKDRRRQAAEYRLTMYHCDATREPPSKAFMRWQPEAPRKHFTAPPVAHHGATSGSVRLKH
jgi:hypothetical protein